MYTRSRLTNKIYFNGVEVPQDDTHPMWQAWFEHISNGGVVTEVDSTPEEVSVIEVQEALRKETELYRKRQCDGVSAYAEISAEFRLAKLNGIITEEAQREIERALIPTRNEVLAGQWISAKNELELLGSNIIGQELYDRLHNQIINYINQNY